MTLRQSDLLGVRQPQLIQIKALAIPAAFVTILTASLLLTGHRNYPFLHTALDTATFLLSGLLAFMLWDMGKRLSLSIKLWMSVAFMVCALFEFIHILVSIELTALLAPADYARDILRPSTWGVGAYLLPIGLASSLLWHRRGPQSVLFGISLLLLGVALLVVFYALPRYSGPVWLGMTRPTLILVPILWAAVSVASYSQRSTDRLLPIVSFMAAVLCIGSSCMLFSRSPHDVPAMLAHLLRVAGYLALFMSLLRLASTDMQVRIEAEAALARLNDELESRVLERTAALEAANDGLQAEMAVRRQAEMKSQTQLQRLHLLHQITRAVGERQDLPSIFRVVIHSVEDNLPIDFSCVCLHDSEARELTVAISSAGNHEIPAALALSEGARLPIDTGGLSRCVAGELVYEPDTAILPFAFAARLVDAGLRSFVIAPLRTQNQVFGVFIVARTVPEGFSSGDCEFLRQLCEHVGLAAYQAQLYGALQRAYDELRDTQRTVMQQERLRVLGQMASGVAHDINNGISPIALYTDALLSYETGLSERARGYLTIVKRAIADVAKTVNRMRDFCRPREAALDLKPVDLNRIVDEVLELTRVRWADVPQEHGAVVDVRKQLVPSTLSVLGVESEIRDALTNLVFNGLDAMPEGGSLILRTQIDSSTEPPRMQLEVSDTGSGMDETTRSRCLEPFYTTKGTRGTGLGLAMVFGMVQRHEAHIEIESALDLGTTIRIIFPTATDGAASAIQPAAVISPARILIIDDDLVVLESVRACLAGDGHEVVAKDGGQAGIDAFVKAQTGTQPFALVVSDLGMPYVDGRRVAAAVKAIAPDTPVVMLTGWGQRLIEENELPVHVDRVISKPPALHDLRMALADLCRTSAGRLS